MKYTKIIASLSLIGAMLSAPSAYATVNRLSTTGTIPLVNGEISGIFLRTVSDPFRVTDSYGDGHFLIAIGMDSFGNDYQYILKLDERHRLNYVSLSSRSANSPENGPVQTNYCTIEFRWVSPTEASYRVVDGTSKGCGFAANDTLVFNYSLKL